MGGAFELKQVTWALRHAALSPEAAPGPACSPRHCADVDLRDWFTVLPWRPGCVAAVARVGSTRAICWSSGGRSVRRVLAQPAIYGRGLRPLPGRAEPALRQLVRPVCALHHRELHAPLRQAEEAPSYPGDGPLDARPPLRDVRRRRGLRSGRDALDGGTPRRTWTSAAAGSTGHWAATRARTPRRPVLPDGRRRRAGTRPGGCGTAAPGAPTPGGHRPGPAPASSATSPRGRPTAVPPDRRRRSRA